MNTNPTETAYGELRAAYEAFNDRLFGGALPACLITLQPRERRVWGYFSPSRFGQVHDDGVHTDEIAINPLHFKGAGFGEAMQTLVHEMCHLWQHHFGTPGRGRYHNQEWADRMESLGLMPSDTGRPGGRRTGDSMGDYPIPGGLFERVRDELVAQGFHLTWYDRAAELVAGAKPPVAVAVADYAGGAVSPPPVSTSGRRVKFVCPGCRAACWGAGSLDLICRACDQAMAPAGP